MYYSSKCSKFIQGKSPLLQQLASVSLLKKSKIFPKLTELLSWNGPTVHVCCFMLTRASTKTFVSRVQKNSEKILRQPKNSLAGSLISRGITVLRICSHSPTVLYRGINLFQNCLASAIPKAQISTSITRTYFETTNEMQEVKTQDLSHSSELLDKLHCIQKVQISELARNLRLFLLWKQKLVLRKYYDCLAHSK